MSIINSNIAINVGFVDKEVTSNTNQICELLFMCF